MLELSRGDSLCVSFDLAKSDIVAKGINNCELPSIRSPVAFLQPRPHIPVLLGDKLLVIPSDSLPHHDTAFDTRASICMMFAEVQNEIALGDLAIQWRVVVETVIPVYRESEEVKVEFVGLFDVEYP